MEQDAGFFVLAGFVGQDGDVAVGVLAMNQAAAGAGGDAQALGADGHTAVGADLATGAQAPDVRPPGAAGERAQGAAVFPLGQTQRGIGGAAQFPVDFLGVAVAAQGWQQGIGGGGAVDGFGSEERRQAALPVLVLPFDFALGLGYNR